MWNASTLEIINTIVIPPTEIPRRGATGFIEADFDEQNRISIKRLNPGDTFVIPTGIVRVHRNRFDQPSLNYWEYQGNALALITEIKHEGLLDEKFPSQEINTSWTQVSSRKV